MYQKALTGTDTSSFLDILQAYVGHAGLLDSSDEVKYVPIEEVKKEEGAAEETKTGKMKEMGNLASAELVFPFMSIPLVIVGIPENLLPLCGSEVQSSYHCQSPVCS